MTEPIERAIAAVDPTSREALLVEVRTLRRQVTELKELVESGMYAAALIILAMDRTEVRIPATLLTAVGKGTELQSRPDPLTGDIIFRVRRAS